MADPIRSPDIATDVRSPQFEPHDWQATDLLLYCVASYGLWFFFLPKWWMAFPNVIMCMFVQYQTFAEAWQYGGRPFLALLGMFWNSLFLFGVFAFLRLLAFGV